MNRAALAKRWAKAITKTVYIPADYADIERGLLDQVHRLVDALIRSEFSPRAGRQVGAALVAGQFTGQESLPCSMALLGRELMSQPEALLVRDRSDRVIALLGAMAAGYVESMRHRIFDQQEEVKQALLKAKKDEQLRRQEVEAKFAEVFSSSAVGIAISDLSGNLVQTNQSLGEILGYTEQELATHTLRDLFDLDDVEDLARRYLKLAEGRELRFRLRSQLLTSDGGSAWVYLAVSLLRDGDGAPQYFVTMVEDITELRMLQDRITHQSLHDVLTGLPNRQYFASRLQAALGRLDPALGLTVYHLDIDGFAVINEGLSQEAGDQLLRHVGRVLKAVVATESRAMVARMGADEFAILIENTPATPQLAVLAEKINTELGEPVYLEGCGVAVSASIGVVQQHTRVEAGELLRAVAGTLRRVKATGRRQWAPFDRDQDAADRARFKLAAAAPGAWESGEFRLQYQPVLSFSGRAVVGVQASLCWDHPELGALPHAQCVDLAEETGLILSMGAWMLQQACVQAVAWKAAGCATVPTMGVDLTSNQAQDPDLVRTVRRILDETGLAPDQLRLGLSVGALSVKGSDAEDNLMVLADMGVGMVVYDAGVGRADVSRLNDLPARAVKVAAGLVSKVAAGDGLIARAATELVSLLHESGREVVVDGIDDARRANWWQAASADSGTGAYFAEPGPASAVTALIATH